MNKIIHRITILSAIALLAFAGTGCTAKLKASYHLKRAERYYDAGKFAQAEIEYRNVLHNAPQNAEAWARLGLIYYDQGRTLEAASILVRANQLDTNNLAVRLKLGTIHANMGQLRKAQDEANFVLAHDPQNDQALILLASSVGTNDLAALEQRLQALRQKGDRAGVEVGLGILALHQKDLKAAESCFKQAVALDPKFSDAYTALGNFYAAQKEMKPAEAAFQKAAEFAPPYSGNDVRYAQFKVLAGDTSGAEKLLHEVTQKTPDYLPAWMALAQIAVSRNDATNALTLIGNVLSRDPQNFAGLSMQGGLQLASGKTAQAISTLEWMGKLYPKVPSVRYQLAQAYLANNQTNEASDSLNLALKLNPKYVQAQLLLAELQIRSGNTAVPIVALRQLIQQQPKIVQAWLLLADAYLAQGSLDNAVQVYQELAKAYPKSPQVPLLLGNVLYQQKKSAEARTEFEHALALAPDSLPALEQLVKLDLAEKKFSDAVQRVRQLTVKNPNEAALQLLLGRTLAAGGETNQAEVALAKAITLQPDSQTGYLMLAQLYFSGGQPEKALADLSSALAKDPKNLAALLLTAQVYDSKQDYDKSRDAYEKVLAAAPTDGLTLNNLACVYADHLNQLDKAAPLAQRARDVAPTDPSVADTLGWILFRQDQYDKALSLLRESAGKLNQIPVIQYHYGMAAYMTGNEAEARTAFQNALQLPGPFADQADCQQRLDILNVIPDKVDDATFARLQKWMDSHPNDPIALARLAAIYQAKGMTDKALAAYQSILKTSPQNVGALVSLARLSAPTDPAKAYSYAKSAFQFNQNDPAISLLAGRLAFLTGDYSFALTLLQLTAQAQPNNPQVLFDLGEALYSQGKVVEARTAMQSAAQAGTAFSRTDDAKKFLAMTALANAPTQAQAALAQINGILKATPDYVPALMAQAASEPSADAGKAEQIYETVLKHYPDFSPAQKRLAALYATDPANDAKAYALAAKARKALPNDPEVARTLGVIVYRQGDFSRAAGLLSESAQQITKDPELMYYLGMAQYRLKHNAESKAALQQALNLNLSGAPAAEARKTLAELK